MVDERPRKGSKAIGKHLKKHFRIGSQGTHSRLNSPQPSASTLGGDISSSSGIQLTNLSLSMRQQDCLLTDKCSTQHTGHIPTQLSGSPSSGSAPDQRELLRERVPMI